MKLTSSDFEKIVSKSSLFDALTFVSSIDDPDVLELLKLHLINDSVSFFDEFIKIPRHRRSAFYLFEELLGMYEETLEDPQVLSHSSLQDAINKLNELGITPPSGEAIIEELEKEMRKIIIAALKNDEWFQQCTD